MVVHEKVLQEEEGRESSAAVVEKSNCWRDYITKSCVLVVEDVYFFDLIDDS